MMVGYILSEVTFMKKWLVEDWAFEVTVLSGEAHSCRLGMEAGDAFRFEYGCPEGFCPRAMIEIFTWCEVVRCGGDFTHRGCREKYAMEMMCPCNCLKLRLNAIPINRDENGVYSPNVTG